MKSPSRGSSVVISHGVSENLVIGASALARNYEVTMVLVEEILLEPRWDAKSFDLAKQRVRNDLQQRSANPADVAADTFRGLVHGNHILALNPRGDLATIDGVTIDDLKGDAANAVRYDRTSLPERFGDDQSKTLPYRSLNDDVGPLERVDLQVTDAV